MICWTSRHRTKSKARVMEVAKILGLIDELLLCPTVGSRESLLG